MSDKWAVDIVEAMKRNSTPNQNGITSMLMIGKVITANPLVIEINGQSISKHLYANSDLLLFADDNIDKIEEAFENNPSTGKWFDFLKEFHQKYVLKKGDEIVVMQSGIAFYILSKVVAV